MTRTKKLIAAGLFLFGVFSSVAFSQGEPDTAPPSIPANLSAVQVVGDFTRANLTWNASTDDTLVTGYKVFVDGALYGTTTGSGTAGSPYQVNGLVQAIGDTQYTFTVSAYDAANNESAKSEPFLLVVPGTRGYHLRQALRAGFLSEL